MKAVIFDMDGVLIDTQHIHATVQSELFNRHGIPLSSDEITQKFAGTSARWMFETVFAAHKIPVDADAVMNEYKENMLKRITDVTPLPGIPELLQDLHAHNVPLAVASASGKTYIQNALTHAKLLHYFSAVVSANEVAQGKPAPDIFLRAAALLHIAPKDCVVFEDAVAGMQAARAAGMKCIGIAQDDAEYPVTLKVKSFTEVDRKKVLSL